MTRKIKFNPLWKWDFESPPQVRGKGGKNPSDNDPLSLILRKPKPHPNKDGSEVTVPEDNFDEKETIH